MPPVFGPSSPSHSRLWSRAAGRATARVPSQIAITLASSPWSRSSMTSAGAPAGWPSTNDGASSSAWSIESHTITPLPAARPSALSTTPAPSAASASTKASAPAVSPPANAIARAIRTPADSATSWQNAFDVSSAAAARVGPNTGIPAASSASATPTESGASGPTTTSSTDAARATPTTASGSSGSTGTQRTRGSAAIAALPGATTTSLPPGSCASFHARACSRPPPPSTRTRVGWWRLTGASCPSSGGLHGPVAHRPPRPLDGLGPLRPDGDEDDRDAGVLLERGHVAPRVLGQVRRATGRR